MMAEAGPVLTEQDLMMRWLDWPEFWLSWLE